jgi:hypothetical protein
MLKKLEYDVLAAELVAIEAMLAVRSEEEDPIGFAQYSSIKAELENELRSLENRPDRHAEFGIFFGGGPVQGSRGINADFAGRALEEIQSLITQRYAELEGRGLAPAGRLPTVDRSKMLLTNVVRGSIGFVLEEASDAPEMTDTPLCAVVDEISDLLVRIGTQDDVAFDEAAVALDKPGLATLKKFFVMLDEHQATLRVVNGNRDVLLDRHAVSLARNRVQQSLESRDTVPRAS